MLLRSFRPVTNNYIWKLKNKANFVCKSGHIQHYRHFSTEEKPDHDDNTGFMSLVQKNKNKIMLGAGVTGGAVTIYGITSILYNVTTSMMTLTPITSLYYGFLGGAAVATIGSSCIVASRKLRYIHPETAWQKAFYYVNTSDMVRKKLGEIHLYNSEIVKSYRHTSGGLTVHHNKPTWAHPTVDLAVSITGESGKKALVVARVTMASMKEEVEYLAVHFDNEIATQTDDAGHTPEDIILLIGGQIDQKLKQSMMK